jgi:HSP20 family protein
MAEREEQKNQRRQHDETQSNLQSSKSTDASKQRAMRTGISRREQFAPSGPIGGRSFRSFTSDIDQLFEDFLDFSGLGRNWLAPFGSRGLTARGMGETGRSMWSPEIEVFQRGDELVVLADLPGLKRDDVKVNVTNDSLIIQGERRQESEENEQGYYRSERSYGSFRRSIPLPDGVNDEDVKASFRDGVLEITMPVPQQRGRRIEIGEGPVGERKPQTRAQTSGKS